MTQILPVPIIYYNVKAYGAKGDGSTDDTTAINSAIAAAQSASGGVVYFPAGFYNISSPLTTLSTSGTRLQGANQAAAVLQPTSGFSGSQIINITADFCGVADLQIAYANTTYSSNPSANGIQISSARSIVLRNVGLNYINGWGVQSSGGASIANYWCQFVNVHTFQCAQGIHIIGASGSSFNAAHVLQGCNADQTKNGDGYLFEDAHDILAESCYGTVSAGTGAVLHIKGACAALYLNNLDLGTSPGPASGSTMLIESGTNGTPKEIVVSGAILEGGTSGLTVSAGTDVHFTDVGFINNGTYGCNITGGDEIFFEQCSWNVNGSAGSSGRYDFQSSTANFVSIRGGAFLTPQGTGTQQTNNAVNVTAGNVQFVDVHFTTSTPFNGFPSLIRNCPGYNPVGHVSVTLPGSGTNFATKSTDMTYYVSGGTVTAINVAGVATGLTSGAFRIVSQQAFSITYSVAPTVNAFSD